MSEEKAPVDELFGDEDAAIEPKQPPPPDPFEPSSSRRFGGRTIALIVGALVLIIGWWLSSRHHDNYYIVVQGQDVHVERGYYFPFGAGKWSPNRAYEPFRIPSGIAPEETGPLSAEELDGVLHKLYVTVAERELDPKNDGNPDVAEDMLMRANKLQFTSVDDDRKLLEMLGDVAFRRGLTEVYGIQSRFDEALKQFRLAAQRGGVTFKGANRWVETMARQRDEIRQLAIDSNLDPDKILAPRPKGGTSLLPIPLPPPEAPKAEPTPPPVPTPPPQ